MKIEIEPRQLGVTYYFPRYFYGEMGTSLLQRSIESHANFRLQSLAKLAQLILRSEQGSRE